MKKLLLALLIAAPTQAATITFEDGSQVEFPDSWLVNIEITAEQPPVECPEPPPIDTVHPWVPHKGKPDPRIEHPSTPSAINKGARDPRIDSWTR